MRLACDKLPFGIQRPINLFASRRRLPAKALSSPSSLATRGTQRRNLKLYARNPFGRRCEMKEDSRRHRRSAWNLPTLKRTPGAGISTNLQFRSQKAMMIFASI